MGLSDSFPKCNEVVGIELYFLTSRISKLVEHARKNQHT